MTCLAHAEAPVDPVATESIYKATGYHLILRRALQADILALMREVERICLLLANSLSTTCVAQKMRFMM